jgi:translation initiation factor 2 alpha subunit (eIF-2alpha)
MATSSASPSLTACVIELAHSKPNQFGKEHCISKFEELQCAIEKLVDFESIQANGIHGIKEAFEKQELMYYFDMLNGPVYSELVKDFWMKATITTKKTYTKYIEKLIENNPELAGKIPQEME